MQAFIIEWVKPTHYGSSLIYARNAQMAAFELRARYGNNVAVLKMTPQARKGAEGV